MLSTLIQKDAVIAADPREARAALIAKLRGDAPYISLRADVEAGARQGSCRLVHAANGWIS